eukprot:GHUV01022334.1.p1 GENE.GHUV01022334.1~~GHUV01022334.1.p1  ORF type:complete len:294 (+),score=96.45 GHUV01022334.1:302-1183(+)
MQMKRKKEKSQKHQAQEGVPDALAAYGEQFMSMFDDYDEQLAKRPKQEVADPGLGSEPSSNGAGTSGASDGEFDDEMKERQASHLSAGPSEAASGPGGPSSKLQTFLSGRKGTGRAEGAAAPSKAQLLEQQRQLEQQRLVERKLKKQFLSAKVSKIFSEVDVYQLDRAQGTEPDELTPEEFAQMRRDVELLGASALDKRSAKAWKASMLARLGASVDKAPRTPAKIGLGMAKKAKQREAVALQEAIAAGMVKAKGRGKKIRAEKAKQRDKGLMEAGPGFRNGVLKLGKKFNKP